MAEQASLVQEGVDRLNEAVDSLNGEFQRVQRRVRARRKNFEKQIKTQRRDLEKETRKRVKKVQTELRRSPTWKRLQSGLDETQEQIERGVETLLGAFGIASKSDVQRLDRKLSQISRKLKDLEKARKSNGAAATAV